MFEARYIRQRKLLNFKQKQRRMDISQELLVYAQSPSITTFRSAKTEKRTSSGLKCRGFVSCFLRFQLRGASWIHVTRSYGQLGILPWSYASFAWNNSFETHKLWKNKSFCTMITHQLTHQCVSFWLKTKPYSWPGLDSRWLFPLPKI